MKVKIFKKKIETMLLQRNCKENNYLIFFSNAKNDSFSVYSANILKYSLKYCFKNFFKIALYNNFLKFTSFFNRLTFNSFITSLKSNFNSIFFIKFKNLYIFNSNVLFAEFINLASNPNYIIRFILNLKTLAFCWLAILKLVLRLIIS